MLWSCFGTAAPSTESLESEGNLLFVNNKLGKIQEGTSITFYGTTNPAAERFIIDFGLDNPNGDIALRVTARIKENIIARNSRISKYWGTEETCTSYPFTLAASTQIQLQVLFTLQGIMVAYDGFHVAKYDHHLPYHQIQKLTIKGDVGDIQVKRSIVTDYPKRSPKSKNCVSVSERHIMTGDYDPNEYPDYSEDMSASQYKAQGRCPMPLPYYASFPKGFFDMGYSMVVWGQVRSKPHSIKASLQAGQHVWPQPIVALLLEFQFNPRKDGETGEPMVIRNSFSDGSWRTEIKSELATGLRPGSEFRLTIVRNKKSFEIFINDRPITEFVYHVNPKHVDTLLVSGDLMLYNVEIEESD